MDTSLITEIVGWLASITMVLGYLPQAWHTIRTRNTEGIALPTFLLLGAGSVFFVIQGFLLANWPLVVTNSITTLSSAIVFGIKVRNDRNRHRP